MKAFREASSLTTNYRGLNKIVPEADRPRVYRNIETALKFAQKVRADRSLPHDPDPLSKLEAFFELASEYGAKIDEATILAAIIYPSLQIKRANKYAVPDMKEIKTISDFLEKIGGQPGADKKARGLFPNGLSAEVEMLVRSTIQVSEINRGGTPAAGQRTPSNNVPQTDEELAHAFLHMLMEVVKDPRVIRIRGAEWLINMRDTTLAASSESATHEDMEKAQKYLKLTKEVYIPLAAAYGDTALRDLLFDQYDRMYDPSGYKDTWESIIATSQQAAPAGKSGFVTNRHTAKRIVIEDIANDLKQLIPDDYLYAIEGGIKSAASTKEKKTKHASVDDIVRLRIVIKSISKDASPEEIIRAEEQAANKIHAAIHAAARKDEKFSFTEQEKAYQLATGAKKRRAKKADVSSKTPNDDEGTSNAVEAIKYEGGHKNYYKEPKLNGYRAIHNIFIRNVRDGDQVRSTRFEIQIVGEYSHQNNQHGTAAHSGSYKYSDLPRSPDPNRDFTVSIFTPNNNIVELTKTATATDFIASRYGIDAAFSTNDVTVKRHPNGFFEKGTLQSDLASSDINTDLRKVEGHKTQLRTGDTVYFSQAPDLLHDPEHREYIIKTCALSATRDHLIKRHKQLSDQAHAIDPHRPDDAISYPTEDLEM